MIAPPLQFVLLRMEFMVLTWPNNTRQAGMLRTLNVWPITNPSFDFP